MGLDTFNNFFQAGDEMLKPSKEVLASQEPATATDESAAFALLNSTDKKLYLYFEEQIKRHYKEIDKLRELKTNFLYEKSHVKNNKSLNI